MLAFATGFMLSLSLCSDLGIVNVAIIRAGVMRGIWRAFLVGLGSSFGDVAYALLSMLGIAALLHFFAVRVGLWLGGTVLLLLSCWRMIREIRRPRSLEWSASPEASSASSHGHFWLGFGLALASPTSILWFAAVGGSIIASVAGGHGLLREIGFFSGFFAASVSWSLFAALLSGLAGRKLGGSFVRAVSVFSAGLYLYFAVRVFWHGWQSFVLPPLS